MGLAGQKAGLRALLWLSALALAAPAGAAAGPGGPSATFAREALRICVDGGADPTRLRALAKAEKWAAIAPASLKSHQRVATAEGDVPATGAWKVEKDGLTFSVSFYETPGNLLFESRCELGAWGLDLSTVSALIAADARLKDRSQPGWPIKQYEMETPRISIVYAAGEMDGGVLHTFVADRR